MKLRQPGRYKQLVGWGTAIVVLFAGFYLGVGIYQCFPFRQARALNPIPVSVHLNASHHKHRMSDEAPNIIPTHLQRQPLAVAASQKTAPEMPTVQLPSIPARTVDIRDHGGVGDGKTLNTRAFADAISACAQAGGGRVLVPAGTWLTGPIHLKSRIELHLAEGAEVRFSTRASDYLPVVFTRFEGIECYNYSPLIYAKDCEHVAVTGTGVLNGQGQAWWPWKDRQAKALKSLHAAAHKGIPARDRVFGTEKHALRPSFVQLVNCTKVLIEGVTIRNGPMWTIHPLYCEDVTIRKVTVLTKGPNTDGVVVDSCRNVLIEHCSFSTGDDCIAVKSGRDRDGLRVGRPSENIIIRHCRTTGGHGSVVVGSEMSGGVRNLWVHDCHFNNTRLGVWVKSARGRGGVVEGIRIHHITMGRITGAPFRLDMAYRSKTPSRSKALPTIRNIRVRNLVCRQAGRAALIRGLPERPIENVVIENFSTSAEKGIFCADARDIHIRHVNITPQQGPVMLLTDARDIRIEDSVSPGRASVFVQVEGKRSGNIRLVGNDLSKMPNPVVLGKGMPAHAVVLE